MKFEGYGTTQVGSREMNQDSFLVDSARGLFAVADGVGGGVCGDVASSMAVAGLKEHPAAGSTLADTFRTVQEAVFDHALESVGDALMGTTMTAVLVSDAKIELCHVGDSRCYLLSDGVLTQLTEDHEIFDEAHQTPVLSSYIGIDTRIYSLKILEAEIEAGPGDKVLICSDGLYKQVSAARIIAVLSEQGQTLKESVDTLVEEASLAEHSDNVTAVVIEILA